MKRLLEFYMPLILTSLGTLVTGGCLTGCGSDPALLLFAVDIVQQEEINALGERLDNLPVPQDGVDGEDGVTTVIVVRQPLPDPIVIPPVVQIDPVCDDCPTVPAKIYVCHCQPDRFNTAMEMVRECHTLLVGVPALTTHMTIHDNDYMGACE